MASAGLDARPPGPSLYRPPQVLNPTLIDCEEDRTLRAVLVGMLREADR